MKGTKAQKGITLIALIITIVVLLILAAVAISSIQNDGILSYAGNAAALYNQSVKNEEDMLDSYLNYFDDKIRVTRIKNKVLSTTSNTEVYDEYDNKIVVPAGFMIRVDDTTNNADTVTEGIVIEHGRDGNQFVWIPVGVINHLDEDGEETITTITLGRYSWDGSTGTLVQPTEENPYTSNVAITSGSYNFTEYQSSSTKKNAKARNISDFYESVMGTAEKEGNGGYYIGRYEAGDSSNTEVANRTGTSGTSTDGTLVCKANQVPYNWILQPDASSKCQSMYPDGYKKDGTGTYSSDLINSYAWDTAIMFIQTFGTKSNSSTYASTVGKSSVDTSAPQLTGVNRLSRVTNNQIDEQLNIYDMAGNCWEWSTETYSHGGYPCVIRGGCIYTEHYTSSRKYDDMTGAVSWSGSSKNKAFRPIIYVGL